MRRHRAHGCGDDDGNEGRKRSRVRLWWFRAHLRRRLFWWFGITIVLTAVITGTVGRAFSTDEGKSVFEKNEKLVVDALGPLSNVAAVRARAQSLRAELNIGVRVVMPDGTVIVDESGDCRGRAMRTLPVDPAQSMATVSMCNVDGHRGASRVAGFLAALMMLWAVAGLFARRLARPFEEVARVARAIADGDLSARARVPRRARGEDRVLAETVNDMASRIERQLDDQRELLAAVSHELRTPLGHLRIVADTLEDLPDDEDRRRAMIQTLREEVTEMDALVGDLLASSRLDFRLLNVTTIPLSTLLDDARARIGRDDVIVDAPADGFVNADRTLLLRAVANLVSNAERHGAGLTRLRAFVDDEGTKIEAWDRGRGLSADALRLVETGERALSEDGLGLGLSLVRRIAEAHGGRAYARNRSEGGAVVGIVISAIAPARAAS